MDLLQTVRKSGSRGGVNFSWDDVKSSQHRENYLGHSLMAPVGRWQKNKDLGWYARAEDAELTPEQRAEKEAERKREERRKVKEAEEDAMAKALGLPVPDRNNANEVPLGMDRVKQGEVNKALKEALGDDDVGGEDKGVGYESYGGVNVDNGKEVLKGSSLRKEGGAMKITTVKEAQSGTGGRDLGQEMVTENADIDTGTLSARGRDRDRKANKDDREVEIGGDMTKATRGETIDMKARNRTGEDTEAGADHGRHTSEDDASKVDERL